jgi:hypothetical protein
MSSSIQVSHWLTIAELKWMQWCMLSHIETGLHHRLVVQDRLQILTKKRNPIDELDLGLLQWSPVVFGDQVETKQELQVGTGGGAWHHSHKHQISSGVVSW